MNMNYRKGQFVGFVRLDDPVVAVPLPRCWYVRRVVPGRDASVIKALTSRGVCAYSPTIIKSIDRKTGKEAFRPHLGRRVLKPFLAGLIFIPDFEIYNRFMRNDAKLISFLENWLFVGELPAMLPVGEMAKLQAIVTYLNTKHSRRKAALGDLVRIVDGPLAQFVGKVERLDSRGRLKVFIDAITRGVSVSLTETQIELIGDRNAV